MITTMHAPRAYPCRILPAVTGLSPQVVTETLYALAVPSKLTFDPAQTENAWQAFCGACRFAHAETVRMDGTRVRLFRQAVWHSKVQHTLSSLHGLAIGGSWHQPERTDAFHTPSNTGLLRPAFRPTHPLRRSSPS